MILRIDHLGIAVRSLAERLRFYEEELGVRCAGRETVASQQVEVAFLPVGESRIELLEPLAADSPVGRFLERRGEGIHHLCLEVTDLRGHLELLRSRGARLATPEPVLGAEGRLVAFVHPAQTGGVLIELSERLEGAGEAGEADDRR